MSDNAVTDPEISREITLLGQQGSRVQFGDVLSGAGEQVGAVGDADVRVCGERQCAETR